MNPGIFAMKNRLITMIVILASLIGGWNAYKNMSRFEDPEFTIRTAVVITQYPGATPTEVANEITEPLESAIQQMQEVDTLESTSSAGLSRINVDIKYEFSPSKEALQAIWSKLRNKVSDAQSSLPPGAYTSIVNDDFGDVYGVYYLLTGEGFTYKELEEYAKQLRTDVLTVEGVAKVSLSGLQSEAIYVEISRDRAAALGQTVNTIYQVLEQQNAVSPAGNVQAGNRRLVIQPSGSIDSVEEIRDLVVSTDNEGTLIYLRDVATVTRSYQTPLTDEIRYNGQPAIGFGISNVTGANVVKMGNAIEAKLASVEDQRPIGIELHEYYHQGKITDAAVENFVLNVAAALVIVLVTLFFFMGIKSAIIIGATLIITIAATLATMYLINIPMHRISLGALIIALGMLVDNAIVVTEGILVGTQRGEKKLNIVKKIIERSIWPLLGGTLVGIIAFAPIGLAPGSTAEYTGHLFWVVMISLMYSWVFAITAVPFLADLMFNEVPAGAEPPKEGKFISSYKGFMRFMLKIRWVPIGATVALFAVSVWGFQFVKAGFFPASTTPQVVVDYWLPEGTDISQTKADMLKIEEELLTYDGIADVQTLIGKGALRYMLVYGGESGNSAYGQFLLKADDFDAVGGLIPKIQAYLDEGYPDAQSKVWRFQLGPGGGSKVEAEFSGPDPAVLRDLADQAKAIMTADGRAISIKDDWRQPVSIIEPIYSSNKGRRLGISRQDLSQALLTNYSGRSVGVYRENDTLIPIIARAPESERLDAESMAQIQIISPATGAAVPLNEVVDSIDMVWRNSLLLREDRVWKIKAQADPVAGDLASDLQARLLPQIEAIELPPGVTLEWGGESGDSSEANEDLASTLPLGFLAMVLVVVILFNGLRQPLVIWLVVPLSLIGVVLGLLTTGTPMEFMAILGLLSLSGLLIKNAIVLVDQMDIEIAEGKARFDAVVDSAASRVRPVMMGALTTVLGVIPLFGDAFFKSMAVVLVFGLTFATLLTLVVVPALYAVVFKINNTESEVA
ncbi:efflux RND transporter permease subunit [Aliiglaciecola sp. M165]|uniref:efflux RND transporter permease subunit n=1 Tax=Aliiglaciecola sp. M165 TaxID=2593649 RepID=UPI00117EC94C|nr:efflux RND transporter permease subunit [Aliiglaciecola sp. M165]TRY29219.1 efflux RND transporter permease subunit [Aliiglaciecola sp. M165]